MHIVDGSICERIGKRQDLEFIPRDEREDCDARIDAIETSKKHEASAGLSPAPKRDEVDAIFSSTEEKSALFGHRSVAK